MSQPRIVSVNVGQSRVLDNRPRFTSSIDKLPQLGPVEVLNLGLAGDTVTDPLHHGGTFQAVYAFAAEELDFWSEDLGKEVRPGLFGENLTTAGIDLNRCVIGEQWRIGTARFQVSSVRIPCSTFKRWLGLERFDNEAWVKRFTVRGAPGVYLSVLETGWVSAEDAIEVLDVPGHGVTASTMFRALTTERALLPLLLEIESLPTGVHDEAQKYVDRNRT